MDISKPLVPLDQDAILFPGASQEQRFAISQIMGLFIAASIYEMEETLIRLRKECWRDIHRKMPVCPEFVELGDLFFEEEKKHSEMFRRYVKKFSASIGVDDDVLGSILPVIEGTMVESILKRNVGKGGQSFWWIVAVVEQEFLLLYKMLKPFKDTLEPLYYDLHEKHFEEEARHASFPYLVLELLSHRNPDYFNYMHVKFDFATAQLLQTAWTVQSLHRLKNVKKIAHVHPLFDALSKAMPLFEKTPSLLSFMKMMTTAPYLNSLVNPTPHFKTVNFAKEQGTFVVPVPFYENTRLVGI